ncbi:MAG TPA: glycosyltransferase [Longimicrobiales bacterium]|nr:glycosyltransferase [Longimicrobiales bacterium]
MMICILHGYLLDGSGSNLWTRSVVRALCADGETVHLVCQEPHPETYDFITAAYEYAPDGTVRTMLERASPYDGSCVMHKPLLGDTLPVYVWDQYEEFEHVVPMTELDETVLEDYLHRNVSVLNRVVKAHGITAMHANHAVLMSVVAKRVSLWTGVPYVVMPHGSALEYAVKPDVRFQRLGADAFDHAGRVLAISDETAQRAERAFEDRIGSLQTKFVAMDLGVDTSAFNPIEPAERSANVAHVKELLSGVARGRSVEHGRRLLEDLVAKDDVAIACRSIGDYVAKQPDEDVEAKLDSIDWEQDQVLAFIGRLIPAKGIHAVIGALPLIMTDAPRLRMIVVGHGPLREPLETLLFAMERGDRTLAERVLRYAETIDAGEPEHLAALRGFWQQLERDGVVDEYWDAARRLMKPDTVVMTGYLTHREMAWLLPCCDAAIFPSMVLESGPLVFLEALSSGVFPIGTYFGGMQVKIDRATPYLGDDAAAMKVRPDAEHIVADIARAVPTALPLGNRHRQTLRRIAEEHYDWKPVARRLHRELMSLTSSLT